MNEQDPTKACIRVLKTESMIRYYIGYILIDLIFENFVNSIVKIFKVVNWCIVRALTRWLGIPILAYWFYWFLNSPQEDFVFFTINIIPMAILGCFILVSWLEVPLKERQILSSYSEYKERSKEQK